MVGSSDLDVGSGLLNKQLRDGVVVDDGDVSLTPGIAQQTSGVKAQTNGIGEGTSVIGQEVNVGLLGLQLLLPCLSGKGVVDGNDVDVLDTLARELVVAAHVAGHVRRAGGSEGSGNTNDQVLAGELAQVDSSLLRVVLLDGVARRDGGSLLDGRDSLSDLASELWQKDG